MYIVPFSEIAVADQAGVAVGLGNLCLFLTHLTQQDKERIITDGDLTLTCRHNFTLPWDPRATDGSPWPEGGGIIIRLAENEYVVAGNGIVVEFAKTSEKAMDQAAKSLGEDGFMATSGQLETESVE